MTDEEFEVTVRDCRHFQKRFFGGEKTAEVVGAAKRLERAIDQELERRAEGRKPKAKTLFDTIDEWDEPATDRQITGVM